MPSSQPAAVVTPPPAPPEQRVEQLLQQMTLAEKLGQLTQAHGQIDERDLRDGLVGSCLTPGGAAKLNALQRVAVEQSRLGIPLIFGCDVIHGYRTTFPVPLALAATWEPTLAQQSAAVAASEASAAGIHWTFAPMVDVARDPRWGRIVEGHGEDPHLGSAFAAALVRGFQGDDFAHEDRLVACVKHFAAYGAAIAGREYNATEVTSITLRSVYLPPFKAALDAGVGTVMTAFNEVDGVPATGNRFLMTELLRDAWGFDGFVVSDHSAVHELVNHGYAPDDSEAARLALVAGCDMEMATRTFRDHAAGLVEQGALAEQTIDEAVRRVLRIKLRAGLFDRPYADEAREQTAQLRPESIALARTCAAKSIVLLKNENALLPLGRDVKSIALIGPLADAPGEQLGSWRASGEANDAVSVLAAMRDAGLPVNYVKGCDILGDATDELDKAAAVAKRSDVAVLVLGEAANMTGEAASRTSIAMPGRQIELAHRVLATGTPTVVVLMNGRPLTLNRLTEQAHAIVESWFGGVQAGPAIVDVLLGDANPGGKLPVTFPRSVGQVPLFYAQKRTGRPIGVRGIEFASSYLDSPNSPLYPFGFGLSYTTFELANLALSDETIDVDESLVVSVDVTNTGQRRGDEVVQIYLEDRFASVTRPVKELCGFRRVTLEPGQTRTLSFTIDRAAMGMWDSVLQFVVEPGEFVVHVGNCSETTLSATFTATRRAGRRGETR